MKRIFLCLLALLFVLMPSVPTDGGGFGSGFGKVGRRGAAVWGVRTIMRSQVRMFPRALSKGVKPGGVLGKVSKAPPLKPQRASWASRASTKLGAAKTRAWNRLASERGSFSTKGVRTPLNKRPSWQQSEKDVERAFAYNRSSSVKTQESFFKGSRGWLRGKKGSTRPDVYQEASSPRAGGARIRAVEVKNYNVSTQEGRSRLVNNVSHQVKYRASHLPKGTRQQVVIDVRGQNITQAEMSAIQDGIVSKSGGTIGRNQISFMKRVAWERTPP